MSESGDLELRKHFDAVLFDNDGVLVDTEGLFLQATREMFDELGVELSDAVYRQVSLGEGRSLFDLVRERLENDPTAIETLRTRRNERYWDLLVEGVDLMHEAVPRVLAGIHGLAPMAIVSSSYRPHFDLIHRSHGLLRYFEFTLADGDYGKHKPHPEPYLTAAERLGVDPGRCLVVEDTERGVQSAVAAGMRCVAIPHDLSRGGDFGAASEVLSDIEELVPLLGLDP